MVEVDRNGLEVLSLEECLHLLDHAHVGRVGCTSGALPMIFPVNYRLVGDEILFRTNVGTKLEAATRGAVVAFEIDHHDPVEHEGWSVVVVGVAREVAESEVRDRFSHTPVARWAPGQDGRMVAISTDMVSGRRIDRSLPAG